MRTVIPQSTEVTGDRQTQVIQEASDRTRRAVNAAGGVMPLTTDVVTFTAGAVVAINHGLARVPTEWILTDVVDGYPSFKRVSWDAKTITIQSANACSARFRVA